jgi:hypothetical protein
LGGMPQAPGRLVRPEAQLHQLAGGCFTGRTRRPGSYEAAGVVR